MDIQLKDCTAMEAAQIVSQLKSANAGCVIESVRKTRKKYSVRLYMRRPDNAFGNEQINGIKMPEIETEEEAEQFLRYNAQEDRQY